VKFLKNRKMSRKNQSSRFKTAPDILREIQYLQLSDTFNFECTRCGECCRNVEWSVLLEPYDLFRIAQYFKRGDRPGQRVEDVIMEYTDITTLPNADYPIFLMKTQGSLKSCVFLKDGRCSIHEAKPKACRLYPLGAWPNDAMNGFNYFIASQKQHHFSGPSIRVSDWMDANFSVDDRSVTLEEAQSIKELAPVIRLLKNSGVSPKLVLQPLIIFKYVFFELDEPFLPQLSRNTEQLKKILLGIAKETKR